MACSMRTLAMLSIESDNVRHGHEQPNRTHGASYNHVAVGGKGNRSRPDDLSLFAAEDGSLVTAGVGVVGFDGAGHFVADNQASVAMAESGGFHETTVVGDATRAVHLGQAVAHVVVGEHSVVLRVGQVHGAVETRGDVLRPAEFGGLVFACGRFGVWFEVNANCYIRGREYPRSTTEMPDLAINPKSINRTPVAYR